MGAGLKRRSAKMSDRATSDLCPPLSSVRLSFHTSPNATLNCGRWWSEWKGCGVDGGNVEWMMRMSCGLWECGVNCEDVECTVRMRSGLQGCGVDYRDVECTVRIWSELRRCGVEFGCLKTMAKRT